MRDLTRDMQPPNCDLTGNMQLLLRDLEMQLNRDRFFCVNKDTCCVTRNRLLLQWLQLHDLKMQACNDW